MNNLKLLYGLVFLSGASGLIYEIVWHRYLAVLLGAQARATALILAIFLGGMCLGYHWFGRLSRNSNRNLIRIYALMELGLAVWALLFLLAFRVLFPIMGSLYAHLGVGSFTIDLVISCLLIAPPTFLMGGTLPLLTQCASRNLENATRIHSRIYGLNTLGAGVGCLLATFVLISKTSLPISLLIAGALNLLVAFISYKFLSEGESSRLNVLATVKERMRGGYYDLKGYSEWSLIAISFLSGFYVLGVENSLVRLIGLSAGSSNYNFGLIVGIFIVAIGFGSFLVGSFKTISNSFLIYLSLIGSLGLYFVLRIGGSLPYYHHLIRIIFRTAPENFYFYQLGLAMGLALALFLPLLVCGMVLPVCFHLLKGHPEILGDRVGRLYSWNSIGCIAGSLGGYFFLQYFNLDDFLRFCLFASLCAVCLAVARLEGTGTLFKSSLQLCLVASLGVAGLAAPKFDPKLFAQAFRIQFPVEESYQGIRGFTKRLFGDNEYVFYKDGPDSSIGIAASYREGKETSRTLYVNGKSDGNTEGDKMTMELTGTLPALLSRRLDKTCVIGFGTGVTVGSLLRIPSAKSVDVVEISQTLSDHIEKFDAYNGGVSKSSQFKLHVMDAFRFLEGSGGSNGKYDLIISEPSTPWLSGVENLYTQEFYALAKKRLTREGVFAQWVQAYAFNDSLFSMVLNTLSREFGSIRVFQLRNYDLLLVATNEVLQSGDLVRAKELMEANVPVKVSLEALGLHGFSSLLALEKMYPSTVRLASEGAPVQHLESPRLSSGAARAFFGAETVNLDKYARNQSSYFLDVRESLMDIYFGKGILPIPVLSELYQTYCEALKVEFSAKCKELLVYGAWSNSAKGELISTSLQFTLAERKALQWLHETHPNFEASSIENLRTLGELYQAHFSPIARLDSAILKHQFEGCRRLDAKTTLYGDCLIEHLKFAQVTEAPRKSDILKVYQNWFSERGHSFPEYEKFKAVNDIFSTLSGKI